MLHRVLWDLNNDLANACLNHPLVRGIADGTLDRDVFQRYIAQDAFFLRAFLRAYALAAAKCKEIDQLQRFHKLMGGVLDELNLHAAYASKCRIDLSSVRPFRATRAYTDFLLRTAWHHDVDEILAAMVPCMRLYAFLGSELSGHCSAGNPCSEWIATYSNEAFQALASNLESLMDAVANDTPAVRDAYRYAMQCELAFFRGPLEETA